MTYYEDPTFNNCDSIKYGVVLNDINWENFSEEINLSGWILSKASAEEAAVCKTELSKYRMQLQRNLTFIHNRLSDGYSLGLNEFGKMKAQTVISKLYSYRSTIAHGGTDTTDLDSLVKAHKANEAKPWAETGIQWAERFIRRLIKRVLVYALREPDIVLDLKGISHKK